MPDFSPEIPDFSPEIRLSELDCSRLKSTVMWSVRSARGEDDTSEVSRDAIYQMREAILAEAGHIQV